MCNATYDVICTMNVCTVQRTACYVCCIVYVIRHSYEVNADDDDGAECAVICS